VRAVNKTTGQIGEVSTDLMFDHVVNKFDWGRMDDPDVYLDDNNARMIMNLRNLISRLATELIVEGKMDSARRVMELGLEKMPDSRMPYDFFILPLADGYFKLGEPEKGADILNRMSRYKSEELDYYFSFPDRDLPDMDQSLQEALFTLNRVAEVTRSNGMTALADSSENTVNRYYEIYMKKVYRP